MIKKNKKGVVFIASTVMFTIALLIFATTIYRTSLKEDEKVIIDSINSRLISQKSSISYAVKEIYFADKDIEASLDFPSNRSLNATLTITTELHSSNALQDSVFNNHITELESFIDDMLPGCYLNSTKIISNPLLCVADGLCINKSSDSGNNQSLKVFYNNTGPGDIFNYMNISITTYADIRNITSNPITNSGNRKINLTINDLDYPTEGMNPENLEDSQEILFYTSNSGYSWNITNKDESTKYLNMSIDSNAVTLTALEDSFNITVSISYNQTDTKKSFYFPDKDAIKINLNEVEAEINSRTKFK